MSEVQGTYRVSVSAVRRRRLLGLSLGPFVAASILLRLYWADALGKVSLLFWFAGLATVIFTTWLGLSASRRWIQWAAGHQLDLTDDDLVLVDGNERERRAFADIASLKVVKIAGRIVRARITYAGRLTHDLSFYERLSDLVVSIQSRLPQYRSTRR